MRSGEKGHARAVRMKSKNEFRGKEGVGEPGMAVRAGPGACATEETQGEPRHVVDRGGSALASGEATSPGLGNSNTVPRTALREDDSKGPKVYF